jgi:hypothetical protein
MIWLRALAVWLLIMVAETLHGIVRQFYVAPLIGDLPARQAAVITGSLIVFAIAWLCIRWIGARTFGDQLKVGAAWVALIVAFDLALGTWLGFSMQRLLQDFNPAAGGFLGFGLLFTLFAPADAGAS